MTPDSLRQRLTREFEKRVSRNELPVWLDTLKLFAFEQGEWDENNVPAMIQLISEVAAAPEFGLIHGQDRFQHRHNWDKPKAKVIEDVKPKAPSVSPYKAVNALQKRPKVIVSERAVDENGRLRWRSK